MNKILYCEKPGAFSYGEIDVPGQRENYALIKVRRIGICGTDLHAFEGTQPYFTYPRVLGHEIAGTIAHADETSGFKPDENVTFVPYFSCGKCIACRKGKPNCCASIKVFGVHIDGGMADYISVPTDSLIHGEGLGLDELALVEPLAIGAHGVRRVNVQPGDFVLVIGAGPIGLGIMEFARIAGAEVIALDVNQDRLDFCKNVLKIKYAINGRDEDVIERLQLITNGDFPTVVIDATGNQRAINDGWRYLAHGGCYVLVGLQKGDIVMPHPEFHKREATLMSSRNATREDFEHVVDSIKKGLINPENYITHRVSFEEVAANFSSWLDPQNKVIKAMVEL